MTCGAFLDENFQKILGHSKIMRKDWNRVIEINPIKVIDPEKTDGNLELNLWDHSAHSADNFVVLSIEDDDIVSDIGHGLFLVNKIKILGELSADSPWWNRFMKNEQFLNSYLYIVKEKMNDNYAMMKLATAYSSTSYMYATEIDHKVSDITRKSASLDPYYKDLYEKFFPDNMVI